VNAIEQLVDAHSWVWFVKSKKKAGQVNGLKKNPEPQ